MDLAIPIAERGIAAVPFILKQLDDDPKDITVRDILIICVRMTLLETYDVKSDAALIGALSSRVAKLKDKGWQAMCQQMLEAIRNT